MTTKGRPKPGPKSRKVNTGKAEKVEAMKTPILELTEKEPLLPVVEVMTCFNQRSLEGRVVINPPQRMAPLRTHATEEKWYFCRFCGRSYVDPIKYNAHLDEHEEGEEEEDSQSRNSQDDSEDEILINYKNKTSPPLKANGRRPLQILHCVICRADISDPGKRRQHMMTFHSNVKCEQCGAGFTHKRYLQKHVQSSHNSLSEFQCPRCPSRLATERGLQHHHRMYHVTSSWYNKFKETALKKMKTVTEVVLSTKPSKGNLPRSGPVQSRVVPNILYRCKICKKTFKKAFNLKIHHRMHTGDRPYPCTFCPQTFPSSNSLWAHAQTNHSDGAFFCSYCTCRFKILAALTAHVRRHHENEAQTE